MIIRKRFRAIACPACHRTLPLVGPWQCPRCRSVEHRHAFARCRGCGFYNTALLAPCCGRTVHK